MSRGESFTFGVPLIARAAAHDWGRIDGLLELTLRSVLAQTDRDFRLLIAGHDVPPCWRALVAGDPRFRFLHADWPPDRPTAANDDGGCKKWLIRESVVRQGGGLLMYLDADDLVDTRLVATTRAVLGPRAVGAVIEQGVVIDFAALRALRLPDGRVFEGGFHRLCGSSTIGRIEPGSDDPLRRDPHGMLGSHHRWPEAARDAGAALARLPVWGGYLVNTSENHSERHGPYAGWRRRFNAAVATEGRPVDGRLAARFGLDLGIMAARSRRPRSGRP